MWWKVYDRDSKSDAGLFDVVIQAKDEDQARELARDHLEELNREDLARLRLCIERLKIRRGILYSNVEGRRYA